MSTRGKIWFTWCIILAMLAGGGAYTFMRWSNVPDGFAGLIATFVLYSAGYFLLRGAEEHDKEATRKRQELCARRGCYKGPEFPKDPFAP